MNTRSRGRRRGARGFSQPKARIECAICKNLIADLNSAIAMGTEGQPIHFDCAIKEVSMELRPANGEKVIYLGNGSFAIVDSNLYVRRKLKIIRRTSWESREASKTWRNEISSRITL